MRSFSASKRFFAALSILISAFIAFAFYGNSNLSKTARAAYYNALAANITATKTGALDSAAGGDANGNGVINPGDRLKYQVVINNSGTDATGVNFSDTIDANTTYVANSIIASPVAVNETYSAIGNVNISVPAANGLLVNDLNPNGGGTLIITSAPTASANGGNVSINTADGSFTYNPPVGFEGADTFSYTLSNGTGLTDTALVTINVSGMIWFISNNAGACSSNCNGRLTNPFTTLAAFNTANALSGGSNPDNNDNIFIYESATQYTGGITLRSGQKLIGQDATQTLAAITNLTAPTFSAAFPAMNTTSPATIITNSGGNGIALGSTGNAIRGLIVSGTSGAGISGVNVAAAIVGSDVSITGASGAALDLSGTTGTNGAIAFGASVTNTSGRAISIQGRSGGAVDLTGAISDNGGTGVFLNSNTGATINFTGGINLITGANAAFTATGGGTVSATQNNTSIVNTITTTTGTALNVTDTNIGASGLNFRSISANGATNGIVLNNTGSNGGLTVTGNGGVCSVATPTCTGGRIQNTTGTDGTTAGNGIYLNNTRNVSLSLIQINDNANFAIRGSGVNGFTLTNSLINGANGTNESGPFNEGSVTFTELTGAASITGSNISGGRLNNVNVVNTAGTLDRVTFDNDIIGANSTLGAHGILIQPQGSAILKATVQNTTFTAARDQLFMMNITGSPTANLIFTGNTLSNNHANIVSGGGGMTITSGGSVGSTPNLTYNITNNTFRDANGSALLISKLIDAANFNGNISGNTIGVSNIANSGSKAGSGIALITAVQGTHTVTITNNRIYQYNGTEGILLQAGGIAQSASGTTTHNAALNTTITGNTISNPGNLGALPIYGIHLNSGTNSNSGGTPDAYQICTDIRTNILSGASAAGGTEFILRQRFNTTIRIPGYAGGARDTTAVTTFVSGNNSNAVGSASTSGTGGGFVGGASCTQPVIASLLSHETDLGNQQIAGINNKLESLLNEIGLSAASDILSRKQFNDQNYSSETAIINKPSIFSQWLVTVVSVVDKTTGYFVPKVSAEESTSQNMASLAAGETVTKSLGVLPAGESITVQFTATVNSTPSTFYSVSNTANITAAGGISINSTTATNNVVQPPSIGKAFGASFAAVNTATTLTYTITNANAAALSGLSFSDTLPAGLIINTPNNLNNTCGGTLTAAQGTSGISLTGGTIGANTICTVKVDVKGTSEGAKTSPTNNINSTNGGSGNAATATLNVIAAPSFTKAFGAATVQLNNSVSLSFTITNNSTVFPLNNVSFTDTLPAGLSVATPNNQTGACGGGTIAATAGSGVISLSGAVLAANTNCTFSVNVTGTTAGLKSNSATLSTTELGTGATATASLTVIAPPTIAKAFSPTSITAGNSSVVTLVLSNPNTTGALTNASFTDTLVNMTATGGAVSGTCVGTAPNMLSAGVTNLSFGGITIPNSGSCTISFSVTSNVPGVQPNTTSGVASNQTPVAGTPSNTANLTVVAQADLTVAKTHAGNFTQGDIGKTYTITVSNSGGTPTSGTVTVTDTLPTGLTATAITGAGWSCVLGTLTCTRSDALSAAGSYPAITLTVNVANNAPASATNTAAVSGGGETNTSNDTANDPATINSAATFTISGQVTNGGAALEGVGVTLSGASSVSTMTDAAGNYSFSNLTGGGNYTVTPSLNGYTFNPANTPVNNLNANQTGVNFATSVASYEADAAPRPSGDGDGTINGGDLTMIRRFVAGIETPSAPASGSEFQRADSAPLYDANSLLVKGDGAINGGDITQVRRYAAGLDAVQPAGGPAAPVSQPANNLLEDVSSFYGLMLDENNLFTRTNQGAAAAVTRDVRPVKVNLAGNVLTVGIYLNTGAADTAANTVDFTLLYDTAVLSSPTNIRAGIGAPLATTVTPNTLQPGKVGIVLDLPVAGAITTFPTGDAQLVLIDFTVAASPPAATTLGFGNSPVAEFVGDTSGNRLTTTFSSGSVALLAPTAAVVTVGGRVMTQSGGRGVNNVIVSMIDSQGRVRTAITNPFGYYRFYDVAAGETYILTAKGKRYEFTQPTQVLNVNEDTYDINFIGNVLRDVK